MANAQGSLHPVSSLAIVQPITHIHVMHDPFELVTWALAIGIAWMILISMTGLDDWLKELVGKKHPDDELANRLDELEERVKQLEKSATH